MTFTMKNLKNIQTPFIIVQGAIDKLVDCQGAFDLMENANVSDKTLVWVPNGWHVVDCEPEFE